MTFRSKSRRSRPQRSPSRRRKMVCETLERRVVLSATIGNNIGIGDQLRNYRLAVATTEEYTAAIGGEAAALASVNQLVSDLNAIYEKELAIHLDLVTGVNTIFESGDNDMLTNGNLGVIVNEGTGVLDTAIGSAAYDIGHVLGTFVGSGTSGLAYLGVVGDASLKGGGGTVVDDISDVGSEGWTLVVAHELGHQFAAPHTFNSELAGTNCTAATRDSTAAYEPASGSTLMSYAGICGADNLQPSEDPVFHSASFEEINTYIAGVGHGPNSTTTIANDIPTVDGGSDYTIPAQTPFSLTAVGTDADPLTYSWEQLDLGAAQSLPLSDLGSGPIFRAFAPTADPTRVFPRLADQLAGVNTAAIGEVLPATNRSLNFRVTARDDNGGVNSDDVLLTSVNTGAPFAVTSPNTLVNWDAGSTQTITWDVAGTTGNGINVSDVVIDLSLDGGFTYPVTLANSTPNDGSHDVNIPMLGTGQARIRVRPVGNVFFDVSDVDFTIALTGPQTETLTVDVLADEISEGAGSAATTVTITRNADTTNALDLVLSSKDTSEVTIQPTVTIPAGQTSVTVDLNAIDDAFIDGTQTASISAVSTIFNPNITPDPTFSGDGSVTTSLRHNLSPTNYDLVVQPDGKILAVGRTAADDTWQVIRLNTDGSFDNTFGTGGTTTTTFTGLSSVRPGGVMLHTDGRITVIGRQGSGTAIARYTSAGVLDTTFSGDGRLDITSEFLRTGVVHPDGSITAVGSHNGNPSAALVRINNDGTLDGGFGIGGVASPILDPGGSERFEDVVLQADGKFVVTGTVSYSGANSRLLVARFNLNGTVDTSYGSGGYTILDVHADSLDVNSMKFTPDGGVVVIGDAFFRSDWLLAKFDANGAVDTNFTGDGYTFLDFNGASDDGWDVAVQDDGKILAVGGGFVIGEGTDRAVARFNANGSLDTSFSSDGFEIFPSFIPTEFEKIAAAVLTDDGKLVTFSGWTQNYLVERWNLPSGLGGSDSVDVADDDVVGVTPLAGIDFDISGPSPTNWTSFDFLNAANAGNLLGEDGIRTSIDFDSDLFEAVRTTSNVDPTLSTIPLHQQSLAGIDGISYTENGATESLTATFADLIPGSQYQVYVFAHDSVAGTYTQDVTLTGANVVSFTQALTQGDLFVNGSVGSSAQQLDSYAALVTADANGEISLVVAPGTGAMSAGIVLSGLAIQRVNTIADSLTLTIDLDSISEDGGTSTATVTRDTGTVGNLTVTLTSSDETEATVPSTVVIPDGSDSVAFTVMAVDDAELDGPRNVTITAAATNFNNGQDSIEVTDDDGQAEGPLIGIDFDSGTSSPTNWTRFTQLGDATATNLVAEDGSTTNVDIVSTIGFGSFAGSASPPNSMVPDHTQSLAGIGGYSANNTNPDYTATFSDLPPATDFRVYLFVYEPLTSTYVHDVTLTGSNTVAFTQTPPNATLFVNGTAGSNANALSSYGQVVTSDNNGRITIAVAPGAGSDGVALSGLAIQQVSVAPDYLTLSIDSDSIDENGGVSTATVTRSTGTVGDLTVDLSSDDTGEATVPASVIIPDGSDSVTFNVTGIDDAIEDGTQTVTITASATTFFSAADTIDVTDDDAPIAGPLIGIDFEGGGASPNNWTVFSSFFSASAVNLIAEDGTTSAADITSTFTGSSAGARSLSPNAATIPQHTQSLVGIDTVATNQNAGASYTARFSDLVPDAEYHVYVFGMSDDFVTAYSNEVTITGSNTVSFTQPLDNNDLNINGSVGSSSQPLTDYAEFIYTDSSGEISIVVSASAGAGGYGVAGLAIQETGRSNEVLSVSFDLSEISENGGTATGTVSRNTGTTGDLLVNLSSDDISEATVPATVTIPNGSDFVTFPVTAVDDPDVDGTQTVTITAMATGINSGQATIDILDDEVSLVGPLVGVDFASGGASPNNWTLNTAFNASLTDLIGEDGSTTPFDLAISGFDQADNGTPTSTQLPIHSQSLAGIDGNFYANNPVTMTWSDLNPSNEYEVYVFGLDNFADNQTVTITGAGTPVSFAQNFSGNQLFVNGAAGSSSLALESYAELITPTAGGQITIGVTTGSFLGIGGLAIRENIPPQNPEFDAGDAPSAAQSGFAGSYPVTDAENGAKHDISGGGPTLGVNVDFEAEGVHSAAADADDATGSPDDEDGVAFATALFASDSSTATGSVDVDLQNADPTSNRLDAWVDFNRDGDWDDAGEQIFASFNLGTTNGVQTLNFTIPQDSGSNFVSGTTFARFRVSTTGGLGVTGTAADGEVEDHAVALVNVDQLIVDTLLDESDGDYSVGDLSLREAIELTNDRTGPDSIGFHSSLTGGTISLSIDQLLVTDDLTITGLGASNLTVSGNDAFRVFDLQNQKDIVIDGLTISGGRTIQPGGAQGISGGGAGIRSTGTLLLSNAVVTDNHTSGAASDGGGIFQFGGTLTITDSIISLNRTSGNSSFGGGISTNNANVIITGSTIDGNSTASGGESTGLGGGLVVISGNLTLTDSTVSSNTNTGAGSIGGGVVVSAGNLTINNSTISGNATQGRGAGVLFGGASNTATVTNTTITGNTANSGDGGGISVFQGTFNLLNSTVTGNTATGGLGGGLASYSDGTAISNTVVTSSIIAGNAGSDVDNVLVGLGSNTISSSGFNVVGSGNATSSFGQSTDQTGVSDAGLAPLADNGGPTLTHALLAGSPAIGAGDTTSTETTDQRGTGFARLVGSNVDVGAFELQATDPAVTLGVDNATIPEASGVATFTATLSEISGEDVTVTLGFTGTATGSGTDYNASGSQIVIAAGTLSGSITVTAVPDMTDEDDETVIADITAVAGGTENGTQQATTTILDNVAPVVTMPSPAVTYSEGQLPILLDPAATVTDADSADLNQGTLALEITTGVTADDRLTIREQGTGPGEVSLSGTSVVIDGLARGFWSGGEGTTPLTILLLFGTTPDHVQAMLRNIEFSNVSTDPSTTARVVTANLTDGDGGTAVPATQTVNVIAVPDLDFGDAPTAAQAGGGTFVSDYPVTLAEDGARHAPIGPTLGAARDIEANGTHSAAADADDLAGVDDEEGAQFGGLGVFNTTAAVNIAMGNVAPAKVDAWIDFNRDGDWDDAGEKILDSVDVSNAMQTLNYAVPAGITAGNTFARVRLSTAGGLSPTGPAADGEVEDHLITIGPPQVESVVVNGGDAQRSGITTVRVTFDRVVTVDTVGGDVFEFINTANGNVAVDIPVIGVVGGKTVVDMTFAPGLTVNNGGGLLDGDYVLTIDADRVNSEGDSLDGNGDGTPGDDYVFGASAVDNFYRKYGDFVPNGTVDLFDFAAFRSAFGKSTGQAGYEEGLDAQNDGIINLFDFAQFRANFGT